MEAALHEAEAATDPQIKKEKQAEAARYKADALNIWTQMPEVVFAVARKLRLEAIDLRKEKHYLEAIALLDKARWESNQVFEEASDMIIDIKLEADIPLSVSEQKSLLRRQEGQRCPGMPEEAESPEVLEDADSRS